jgi:ribosomal protein S18 acetylase RimI-like enzyme
MAKVRIRALKKNEIREASVLFREALGTVRRDYLAKELEGEMTKYSEQGIRLMLARGGVIFRVAETDGRLVGIAIADLYPFMPANCWITWIAVKKAYRKRGIGKLLLKSFENEPAGRWSNIIGRARMSNLESNRLFESVGYVKSKTLKRRKPKRSVNQWEKHIQS